MWCRDPVSTSQSPHPAPLISPGFAKRRGGYCPQWTVWGMGPEKNKGVGPPSPPQLPRGGTVRRGKGPGEKTHPQGHPPHAALLSRPQSCLPAPNPAHSADAFQALSPHRKWGGRVLAPLPSLAGVPLELPYPNHRHIRLLAAGLCYYSTSPRGFSTGLTTPFPHGDELRIPTQTDTGVWNTTKITSWSLPVSEF